MKIIQISASYKPAYIYGGPIQSVGKLCEILSVDKRLAVDGNATVHELEVLTTTANGKNELDVITGVPILVDGVPVTYFKRLTKDHSHFSPGLLLNLRKEILHCIQDDKKSDKDDKLNTANQNLKGPPRLTDSPPKEGSVVHIHAWWN